MAMLALALLLLNPLINFMFKVTLMFKINWSLATLIETEEEQILLVIK
jgi:hypothetical protein